MTSPDLSQIEAALRADSPVPDPVFVRVMDRRVSEGFPKPQRRRLVTRRLLVPAFAAIAAPLVVVGVAFSVLNGSDDHSSSSSGASEARDLSGPVQDSAAPSAAAPARAAAGGRHVERSAQITLAAPRGKIQRAADGIGTVAEDHNGYVLRSNVSTGDQGSPGGSFVLRVPASQLQGTLADLSKLGHLRARSESAEDMTASYRNVQDRLGRLLLERRALLLRLKRTTGAAADAIRVQIAARTADIKRLDGRMQELRRRTVYSTVTVTLEQQRGEAGAGGGGSGTGAAWRDSLHTLEALLNFLVRALGVLLPLALLAGTAALGLRVQRRRRREAALL
jgi:hypothetical protein